MSRPIRIIIDLDPVPLFFQKKFDKEPGVRIIIDVYYRFQSECVSRLIIWRRVKSLIISSLTLNRRYLNKNSAFMTGRQYEWGMYDITGNKATIY